MRKLFVLAVLLLGPAAPATAQWDVSGYQEIQTPLPLAPGRAYRIPDRTLVLSMAGIVPQLNYVLDVSPDEVRLVMRRSGCHTSFEIHRVAAVMDNCVIWFVDQPGRNGKALGTIFDYRIMGISFCECFFPHESSNRSPRALFKYHIRSGVCLMIGFGEGPTLDLAITP